MDAACETVSVDLEAMAQARLGDTLTAIHLCDQSIEIGVQVLVDE